MSDPSSDATSSGGALDELMEEGVSRRHLLTTGGAAASLATTSFFWFQGCGDPARAKGITPTPPGGGWKSFKQEQARTLNAALNQILPSGGPKDPGAADVNAIGYLDAVLKDPGVNPNDLAIFIDCAKRLDDHATKRGASDFASLSDADQVKVLKDFEGETVEQRGMRFSVGRDFFKRAVSYTLEAFFGDPVHGGNIGEVAWKWANHRSGFPRPAKEHWRPSES